MTNSTVPVLAKKNEVMRELRLISVAEHACPISYFLFNSQAEDVISSFLGEMSISNLKKSTI